MQNQEFNAILNQKIDSIIHYGKPRIYRRLDNKWFGKINVTYLYLKNDSIVERVTYAWVTPKNTELISYNKQFDETVKQISS